MSEEVLRQTARMKAETVIRNLAPRGMDGFYCESREEAKRLILSLLEPDSLTAWGGSYTLRQLGIQDALREKGVPLIDRDRASCKEEVREMMRRSLLCDTFLMSSNAITLDGELVNIDGIGNRVAALCYGPRKVLVVAGVNKITSDLPSAIERVHSSACAANSIRYEGKTPCAKDGKCRDCKEHSLCGQVVVTRLSQTPHRIQVVLVGESLGF